MYWTCETSSDSFGRKKVDIFPLSVLTVYITVSLKKQHRNNCNQESDHNIRCFTGQKIYMYVGQNTVYSLGVGGRGVGVPKS